MDERDNWLADRHLLGFALCAGQGLSVIFAIIYGNRFDSYCIGSVQWNVIGGGG